MWKAIRNLNKKQHADTKRHAGFTLIEMAISLSIVGLILAASAQLLMQRQIHVDNESTKQRIAAANAAIAQFRDQYGRYPCPAPLTAVRGNIGYGLETDCTDTVSAEYTLGAGITPLNGRDGGVTIVNGQRAAGNLVSFQDRSTTPATPVNNIQPRVRIGALPFKQLNLNEDASYDGYRNRIVYAVTEQLAVNTTFEPDDGAIAIRDGTGLATSSAIDPPNSAHYFIFSAGKNGAGAFTFEGFRNPCAGDSVEDENCNYDVDATFLYGDTSTMDANQANTFDDMASYATHKDVPLWEKNPLNTEATADDIGMKTTGNIGVGPGINNTPTEELQVAGVVKVRDNPETPEVEGKIQVENMCDYSSGSPTCFSADVIAGKIEDGGGLECPAGQFMVGIRNNGPVCIDEIRTECTNGRIAKGIKSDGSLDCGEPPPKDCPTTTVKLCAEDKILPTAKHNDYHTVTAGLSRKAKYQCKDGKWKQKGKETGLCDCTPEVGVIDTVNCGSNPNSGCGKRFTGTKKVQSQYVCPQGEWIDDVVIDDSNCKCVDSVHTWSGSCPYGYNEGEIQYENRHNCSTQTCSGSDEVSRTCACKPYTTPVAPKDCPSGLTGKITYKDREWLCPNGTDQPGKWGPKEEATNTCACKEKTEPGTKDCPPGEQGKIKIKKVYSCTSPDKPPTVDEQVVSDTCEPIPDVTCTYKIKGSTKDIKNGNSYRLDESVCNKTKNECPPTQCYRPIDSGNNTFPVGNCYCE